MGWSVCVLLHQPPHPWIPLWFCAALLFYNVDHLRHDRADPINVPHRAALHIPLQPARRLLVAIAMGLRDCLGDSAAGVRTLPVLLGLRSTLRVLGFLLLALELLVLGKLAWAVTQTRGFWIFLGSSLFRVGRNATVSRGG